MGERPIAVCFVAVEGRGGGGAAVPLATGAVSGAVWYAGRGAK